MNWIKELFTKEKPTSWPVEIENESIREQALLEEALKEDKNYEIPAEVLYEGTIQDHLQTLFPNREEKVFHEILSQSFHIDIHVLCPTKDEPFYVLYTTGMSTLPMNLPESISKELVDCDRAELMMFLPSDWNFGESDVLNTNLSQNVIWPISVMSYLARFPHINQTWLSSGMVFPNGEDFEAFSSSTKLCGIGLISLGNEFGEITIPENLTIQLYTLIPLYKEEILESQHYGLERIINEILALTHGSFITSLDRPCALING